MELNFAKTAPGVMTASWTHPKKGRQYSVAIIESCDTQHLFIDGELIARELPSFDDAVTLAKQKLSSTQPSGLVRLAGALVLASVIGASVVVASKFMPAISPAEIAAAAPASPEVNAPLPQNEAIAAPAITFDTDSLSKPAVAAKAPAVITPTPEKTAPPQQVAVTVTTAPTNPTNTATKPTTTIESETPNRRRFSARNNLLALEAHLTEQREAARQENATPAPATPTVSVEAAPQPAAPATQSSKSAATLALAPAAPPAAITVAIAPASKTKPGVTQTAPTAAQPSMAETAPDATPAKPLIRPMIASAATDSDAETGVFDPAPAGPPLPAKAPIMVKTLAKLTTGTAETTPPAVTSQRKITTKRKASPTRRRAVRKSQRKSHRRPQTSRRTPPRRVVQAAPRKRLVCFAHVCRWR